MRISGTHYRATWITESGTVRVIDQSRLPFEFATIDLETLADAAHAIKTMVVRGAPLIGATAAYGMALAARANPSDSHLTEAARTLHATRPTAINLVWALTRMRTMLAEVQPKERVDVALPEAAARRRGQTYATRWARTSKRLRPGIMACLFMRPCQSAASIGRCRRGLLFQSRSDRRMRSRTSPAAALRAGLKPSGWCRKGAPRWTSPSTSRPTGG